MAPGERQEEKPKYYWESLTDGSKKYYEISVNATGKRQRNFMTDEGPPVKLLKISSNACYSASQVKAKQYSPSKDPLDVKNKTKEHVKSKDLKKAKNHRDDNHKKKSSNTKDMENKGLKKTIKKPKTASTFFEELPKSRFNIKNQGKSKKVKPHPNTFGRKVVGGKKKPHNFPVPHKNALINNEEHTAQSNSTLDNGKVSKVKCLPPQKLHYNEKHSGGSINGLSKIGEIRCGNAKGQSVDSRSKLETISVEDENLENFPNSKNKKLNITSDPSNSKDGKQSHSKQKRPDNVNVFKKVKNCVSECNIEPKSSDCEVVLSSLDPALPNKKLTSNSHILNNSKLTCKEKRKLNDEHPTNIHFNVKLPCKQKKLDEKDLKILKDVKNFAPVNQMEDKSDLRNVTSSISSSLNPKLTSTSELLEVKDLNIKEKKGLLDTHKMNTYKQELLRSEQRKRDDMNIHTNVKMSVPVNQMEAKSDLRNETSSIPLSRSTKLTSSSISSNAKLKIKEQKKLTDKYNENILHSEQSNMQNDVNVCMPKNQMEAKSDLRNVISSITVSPKKPTKTSSSFICTNSDELKVKEDKKLLHKLQANTQFNGKCAVIKKEKSKGGNLLKPDTSKHSSSISMKQTQKLNSANISTKKDAELHQEMLNPIVMVKKISPTEIQKITEETKCEKQEYKNATTSSSVFPGSAAANCTKNSVKTEVEADDDDVIFCGITINSKPKTTIFKAISFGYRCICESPGCFKCSKCMQSYCAQTICQLQDKCRIDGGYMACMCSQEN